jgi:hypothetical protein
MKTKITGRLIAIDHLRQAITVKPDNSTPVRIYAGDKIFTSVIQAIETDRLNGNNETRGAFIVSGKVAVRFKRYPGTVMFRIGNWFVESENRTLYDFIRLLNHASGREPSE